MLKVSDIIEVHVSLYTDGKPSLWVFLAADGTINRLGTGAINNEDKDLFIGTTKQPLFEQLLACLDDGILDHLGGYDVPEKRGVPCELSIGFSFNNSGKNGFGFRYGSESEGPPHEIVELVTAAVRLSNPWFEEQKKMIATSQPKSSKPWWKFW